MHFLLQVLNMITGFPASLQKPISTSRPPFVVRRAALACLRSAFPSACPPSLRESTFGIYSTAKLKKYEVCVCVSMSTEKKLSPCKPQNNTSPQRGRWQWTASGSETPRSSLPMVLDCLPLVVTNPTWPQTLKASQRLKFCFLIKHLKDSTKL